MYALFCKVGKEVQLLDFDDYPLNIQQPLWPKNASEWAEMVETNKESYWIGQNRLEPAKTWPRNDWTSRKMKEIHWNIVEPAEIRYASAETQFVPKKKNTAHSAEKQRKQAERWLNRPKFDVHPPKILNRPRLGWHEFGQPHKHLYPDQGYPYPEQWITYTDNQTRHRSILFQIKLS